MKVLPRPTIWQTTTLRLVRAKLRVQVRHVQTSAPIRRNVVREGEDEAVAEAAGVEAEALGEVGAIGRALGRGVTIGVGAMERTKVIWAGENMSE
jgi:hypothetical protein